MPLMYLYLLYRMKGGSQRIDLIICVSVFLLLFFPVLLIHNDYYTLNKGDELEVDPDNKQIRYKHDQVLIEYKFEDIKNIKYYLREGGRLLWTRYKYCVIEFTDGVKITITTLLVPDIESFFKEICDGKDLVIQIPKFFPTVYKKGA